MSDLLVLGLSIILLSGFLMAHMFVDSYRSDALKARIEVLEAKVNGRP